MRRTAAISTLLLLLCTAFSRGQQVDVVDGIAAIVNEDVITISQVRELVGERERAMREAYPGPDLVEKIKEMRLAALKDLVDRQLIIQEFRKMQEDGANIPDYVVDDRVRSIIREEFGGDRAAFVRTLRAQGYTLTRFREIEREKIIVQAMRQAKVTDNFVISPLQVRDYYEKNIEAFTMPEQVKLRMIILREGNFGDTGLDLDKRQTAGEIRQKLAEGADFDRMARMYSEDEGSRDFGGDWGWIERNTLTGELTDIAFKLKPGEISEVVELQGSYYILQAEARKEAAVKPVSEVREEIERDLIQKERLRAQQRWIDTLRAKSYIKILS